MQPEHSYRELCLQCRRARASCWCNEVRPVVSRAKIILLQHPREARNPIGTARMTHKSLPGSQLISGVDFSTEKALLDSIRDPARRTVVLYPSPTSRDARELQELPGDLNIVVIDGTWSQARKVWNRNPVLHALPAYRLDPVEPGQYRIRKEPAAHCLATIEAVQQCLDIVDGETGLHREMLRPFTSMVDRQLTFATGTEKRSRHAWVPRKRKVRKVPSELRAAGDGLLLIHGESNGWPGHRDDVPPIELLQWDALRPATGERFHAILSTETRNPSALGYLELDEKTLATALSPEEFRAAWARFVRPDDVLCTWGYYSVALLQSVGLTRAEVINLQQICTVWTGEKLGTVERANERMGPFSVVMGHPGRGSRRLMQMDGLVRLLRSHA